MSCPTFQLMGNIAILNGTTKSSWLIPSLVSSFLCSQIFAFHFTMNNIVTTQLDVYACQTHLPKYFFSRVSTKKNILGATKRQQSCWYLAYSKCLNKHCVHKVLIISFVKQPYFLISSDRSFYRRLHGVLQQAFCLLKISFTFTPLRTQTRHDLAKKVGKKRKVRGKNYHLSTIKHSIVIPYSTII